MKYLLAALLLVISVLPAAAGETLTLGVLAYRPKPLVEASYQPLAEYLSTELRDTRVVLAVLDEHEMKAAMANNRLDLAFTTPSHYLALRAQNALTGALATVVSRRVGEAADSLGGVIITASGRKYIQGLDDLDGRKIAIPSQEYLAGHQVQAYELLQRGIRLPMDAELVEVGNHDAVIDAVLSGTSEVGFIRSGILESLAAAGRIDPADFKVINRQHLPGFPYQVSTRLYPEWPLLALPHVDAHASRRIAGALLALEHDHPAARAAGIAGFTIAADYLPVEKLAKALHLPPFDTAPEITVIDLWQNYRGWILALSALLLLLTAMTIRMARGERRLREQSQRLAEVIWGTNIGTWEWEVQTGLATFNERWAEISGYTLGEISPTDINSGRSLSHPDDLERSKALLERCFRRESKTYECEIRTRHKNGSWVWVLDRGRVVEWTHDGQPRRMSGTRQDISAQKKAAALVADDKERLHTIFEIMPVGILLTDREGRIVECNSASERMLGIGKSQLLTQSVGDAEWDVFGADGNPMAPAEYAGARALAEQRPIHYSSMEVRTPGSSTWLRVSATPLEHPLYGVVVAHIDVTDKRNTEARLRLAASVFTHAREGIVITDAQARIIEVNDAFTAVTGYRRDEVSGQSLQVLQSGLHPKEYYKAIWRALLESGHWHGEMWSRRKNGEVYAEMLDISAVRDSRGRTQNYVALFTDITPLKDHQKQLERIAYHDPLTNLPNRALYSDRLQQAMAQCSRRGQHVAIAYIDLDGFKAVNDNHGHHIGDQLLVSIALRLREVLREGDTLARLGGDEFATVLVDLDNPADCQPVLERLLHAAADPVPVGTLMLSVSASIGVTLFPQDKVDADQLVHHADTAMYRAKRAGKNTYRFFDTLSLRDSSQAARSSTTSSSTALRD
ncbi:PhnD/SsuA/transferrin family substrate-binding protein [Aromatoleum bremense]|uniref:PhnD/SsuA/transferrin family substrate-binding protein n=1 Tax=Aromatoleum bremense TaxID=76115 RepID=A0ABX1NXC2_9RHOO|nr:PhnD/SsuA/transferrin family substrate-binding protein [Aromatoleum bremense]NMG16665.1 PhnD/SsuA/transferrin family substrate-binding protein [Aromatoleum bremense]